MDLRQVRNEAEELRKLIDSKYSTYCLCLTIPPILFKNSSENKLVEITINDLPKHNKSIKTIDIDELAASLYDKTKLYCDLDIFEWALLKILMDTTDKDEIKHKLRQAVRHDRLIETQQKAAREARDKEEKISIAATVPGVPLVESKIHRYNILTANTQLKTSSLSIAEIQNNIVKDFD